MTDFMPSRDGDCAPRWMSNTSAVSTPSQRNVERPSDKVTAGEQLGRRPQESSHGMDRVLVLPIRATQALVRAGRARARAES